MKHLHKLPLSFRAFRLNRQNWLIWLVVLIAAAAAACVQPPHWRKGRSFKTWGANRPHLTQAVMFQNLRKGQGNSIPFTIAMLLICTILCQCSFLVLNIICLFLLHVVKISSSPSYQWLTVGDNNQVCTVMYKDHMIDDTGFMDILIQFFFPLLWCSIVWGPSEERFKINWQQLFRRLSKEQKICWNKIYQAISGWERPVLA